MSKKDTLIAIQQNWQELAEPYIPFAVKNSEDPRIQKYATCRLVRHYPKGETLLMPDIQGNFESGKSEILPVVLILNGGDDDRKLPGTLWTVPNNEVLGFTKNPAFEEANVGIKKNGGIVRNDIPEFIPNLIRYWEPYVYKLPTREEKSTDDIYTFRLPTIKLLEMADVELL